MQHETQKKDIRQRPSLFGTAMKARGIMMPDFMWSYATERGGSEFVRRLILEEKAREEYRDSVA